MALIREITKHLPEVERQELETLLHGQQWRPGELERAEKLVPDALHLRHPLITESA